jgi:hypothetical protein
LVAASLLGPRTESSCIYVNIELIAPRLLYLEHPAVFKTISDHKTIWALGAGRLDNESLCLGVRGSPRGRQNMRPENKEAVGHRLPENLRNEIAFDPVTGDES